MKEDVQDSNSLIICKINPHEYQLSGWHNEHIELITLKSL